MQRVAMVSKTFHLRLSYRKSVAGRTVVVTLQLRSRSISYISNKDLTLVNLIKLSNNNTVQLNTKSQPVIIAALLLVEGFMISRNKMVKACSSSNSDSIWTTAVRFHLIMVLIHRHSLSTKNPNSKIKKDQDTTTTIYHLPTV